MLLTLEEKLKQWKRLEERIGNYSLLEHRFYQAWSEGKLSLFALREYSKQYYAHVLAFPTYLSATHANCEKLSVRQLILENLIEEERGASNHPRLWRQFALGLGVSERELDEAEWLSTTRESVERLRQLTRQRPYTRGVAALYAFEAQVPEVAKTKREGLARHYGIEDAETVAYFSVHEEADIRHSEDEKKILLEQCATREDFWGAIEAAEEAAKAMYLFLDGVYRAYVEGDSQN
ncbi:MAG: CADD family putative folate metabolism protein [Planctomycetota bacterium]|nr:MAG: CADD family putative folate metabolism protein [Planctomycetota bacterium]